MWPSGCQRRVTSAPASCSRLASRSVAAAGTRGAARPPVRKMGITGLLAPPIFPRRSGRVSAGALKAQLLLDQDDGDATRHEFAVDDQHLVHPAAEAIGFTGALILAWKAVFIDPLERRVAIRDDLLAPDDPDHRTGSGHIRRQLAPAERRDEDFAVLAHRMHASDSIIRAGPHAPHLRPLRLHVHLHQPWTDRIVAS